MLSKEFLSEVSTYTKLPLGTAQNRFLYYISIQPSSVYDLHSQDNKEIDVKNVRKVVSRLQELALIEIEGYYPRNAIKYRLKSYGIFQLLCEGQIPESILDTYKDDIIIQTFFFQFLEYETIKEWLSMEVRYVLANYLQRCCEAVLSSIQEVKSLDTKNIINPNDLADEFKRSLESSIQRERFDFIYQILTINRLERRYPNERFVPKIALGRDKKFINLAEQIKKNVLDGCKDFMIS